MIDHNVSKLGDKNGEHWAINAQVVAIHVEKGEMNMYSNKNVTRMEELLTGRAQPRQGEITRSSKSIDVNGAKKNTVKSTGGSPEDNGSLKDSASTASDSGGTFSSGPGEVETGRQSENQAMRTPTSPNFRTR